MLITLDDRHKISAAITAAEARTSGEIVCVLARASSDYAYVPLIWAALAALSVPWPLIAFTQWPVQWIYAAQLAAFAILAVLLSFPSLRMPLVPRGVRRLRAHRAASEQFMIRSISRTQARTGILIFVSLAERYARIIADTGIADKVPQAVWQDAVNRLIAECRRDRMAAGFADAVELCGEVLAQHFPPGADNANELPDRLYVI